MAKKVGIQIDVDAAGGIRSFKDLGKAGSDAGNNIDSGSQKASSGLDGMTSSLSLSKVGVIALGAAVATAGYQFVKFAINAEKEAEKVQTQFTTLLGSSKLAKERFEELADFAATTPFELVGIANASKVLQTMGGDALATGEGLKLVGDAAAIANVPIDELAVSIGRAASGLKANRAVGEPIARLQELGLISGEARNAIEELQKQAKGVEAWELLESELKKNEGGMEALSKTADGLESTLSDTFKGIGRTVATETGIFEIYKNSISGLIELGAQINEAFDSSAVEKVRDELDDVNIQLERTRKVLLSGMELEIDTAVFEKREKQLEDQARLLREAIAPADLKDKQKELSELYSDLTTAVERHASATEIDTDAMSLTASISGASYAQMLQTSKQFYANSAEATKARIAEVNAEIEAIKSRNVVSVVSNTGGVTAPVAVTKQEDVSAKTIKNNNDVNESFRKGIEERIALEEARDELLSSISEERKEADLAEIDLTLYQIQQETDAKILQAYELIENEDMLRKAIEDINFVSDKKIIESKKKVSDETQRLADLAKDNEIKNQMDIASATVDLGKEIFGANKLFTIADIGLSTARGIMAALATTPPNPILAGIIGVTGAVQAGKASGIKLADGTEYVTGAGTNRSDSIPASLSVGERVVDSATNSLLGGISNAELASAVRGGNATNITINAGAGTDIDALAQAVTNAVHRANQLRLEPQV